MDDNIACCGVDCSVCADYKDGKCPSCRLSEWKDGDVCMPVKCCRDRGIEYCAQCDDFPCEEMEGFYEESISHREAFLRFLDMNNRDNGG